MARHLIGKERARLSRLRNQVRLWLLVLVPIAAGLGMLFLGANSAPDAKIIAVDLDEKSLISPVQQITSSAYGEPGDDSLRVAIAGVLSPTKTLEYYQDLLSYLEQKLGRRVTLVLKPTYSEINDLIRGNRVDVAFVCSLAYVKGKDEFGMELLVAPQIDGQTTYYSYLIVPSASNARSLQDLRGASFAFTDPVSNSGYLAPAYQVSLLGATPASFFSRYIFTYSHDNSVMAVAEKLIDGAAVDSLVYDQLVNDNAELAAKLKVIARWGPYGIPPVVVNPALDSRLKQELRDFFLALHTSDKGAEILANLAIDRFLIISDDAYSSIREMKAKLGW